MADGIAQTLTRLSDEQAEAQLEKFEKPTLVAYIRKGWFDRLEDAQLELARLQGLNATRRMEVAARKETETRAAMRAATEDPTPKGRVAYWQAMEANDRASKEWDAAYAASTRAGEALQACVDRYRKGGRS